MKRPSWGKRQTEGMRDLDGKAWWVPTALRNAGGAWSLFMVLKVARRWAYVN